MNNPPTMSQFTDEVSCLEARDKYWQKEIAKLREELAVIERAHELMTKTCMQWKDRAEASESKLKEMDEQEPVAYLNLAVWKRTGYDAVYATPERAFDNQDALFAAPVPPVDVQELLDNWQALRNVLEQTQREKAELERKLAEQQASEVSIVVAAWRHGAGFLTTGPDMEAVDAVLQNIGSGTKELNALIAKAREKGRKEAVPEGWQVVPKEPTEEMAQAFWNRYAEKAATCGGMWKAMLAAAPTNVPDCSVCVNRGKVYKLSEESYCSHCKWQEAWRKDLFEAAPKPEVKS